MELFVKLVALVVIAVTLVMLWNSDTVVEVAEIIFGRRDDKLAKLAAELSRLIEERKTAPELYQPVIDDMVAMIGDDIRRLRANSSATGPGPG